MIECGRETVRAFKVRLAQLWLRQVLILDNRSTDFHETNSETSTNYRWDSRHPQIDSVILIG